MKLTLGMMSSNISYSGYKFHVDTLVLAGQLVFDNTVVVYNTIFLFVLHKRYLYFLLRSCRKCYYPDLCLYYKIVNLNEL